MAATTRGRSPLHHVDVVLVGCALAISAIGALMVWTATSGAKGPSGSITFLIRQSVFIGVGVGVGVLAASVDYRKFRDWADALLAASAVLLALVLTPLGARRNGTQGWFQLGPFQLQPSEVAKLALIVWLAGYCADHRGDLDLGRLVRALVAAGVPMFFVMLQPDLGTTLVSIAVVMGVLLVGGARPRHIAVLTVVGVIGIVGILNSGVLSDYQQARLTVFVNPEAASPKDSYNQAQSEIAIGAGGLTGTGLFSGTQTALDYVPEQHTDFIFTAVGEQTGFLGGSAVLLLFAVMFFRIWRTAHLAKDLYGTLLCTGVLSMMIFHVFENVGMTMGIMPITGIPLPFMSYGGSSTLVMSAAIGLVANVHMRRFS